MTVTTQADTFSVQYLAAEDISIAASLIYQAYHDDPILQTMLNYEQESNRPTKKNFGH